MAYNNALKNIRMNAVVTDMDKGAGPALLKVYTAALGTLLCTITLADPSATVAGAGVLTFSGMPKSGTAAATGTIGICQLCDSTGAVVESAMTVSVNGGGGQVQFDTLTVSAIGQVINATAGTITHG